MPWKLRKDPNSPSNPPKPPKPPISTLLAALILMFLSIVPLTEAQEVSGKLLSESDAKGFRMVADEFRATANELRHLTNGPTSDNVARLRIRSILERAHAALQKENES